MENIDDFFNDWLLQGYDDFLPQPDSTAHRGSASSAPAHPASSEINENDDLGTLFHSARLSLPGFDGFTTVIDIQAPVRPMESGISNVNDLVGFHGASGSSLLNFDDLPGQSQNPASPHQGYLEKMDSGNLSTVSDWAESSLPGYNSFGSSLSFLDDFPTETKIQAPAWPEVPEMNEIEDLSDVYDMTQFPLSELSDLPGQTRDPAPAHPIYPGTGNNGPGKVFDMPGLSLSNFDALPAGTDRVTKQAQDNPTLPDSTLLQRVVKRRRGDPPPGIPGYSSFSVATSHSPKPKRVRFQPERRKEVADVREKGACLRCRYLKIPVSCIINRCLDSLLIHSSIVLENMALHILWENQVFLPFSRTEVQVDGLSSIFFARS